MRKGPWDRALGLIAGALALGGLVVADYPSSATAKQAPIEFNVKLSKPLLGGGPATVSWKIVNDVKHDWRLTFTTEIVRTDGGGPNPSRTKKNWKKVKIGRSSTAKDEVTYSQVTLNGATYRARLCLDQKSLAKLDREHIDVPDCFKSKRQTAVKGFDVIDALAIRAPVREEQSAPVRIVLPDGVAGPVKALIDGPGKDTFTAELQGCASTLAGECSMNVVFKPPVLAEQRATMTLTLPSGLYADVALVGTATPPR